MYTRVLLLFWEHVGGCHPREKHRLEEALGALMVFQAHRHLCSQAKAPDTLGGTLDQARAL